MSDDQPMNVQGRSVGCTNTEPLTDNEDVQPVAEKKLRHAAIVSEKSADLDDDMIPLPNLWSNFQSQLQCMPCSNSHISVALRQIGRELRSEKTAETTVVIP